MAEIVNEIVERLTWLYRRVRIITPGTKSSINLEDTGWIKEYEDLLQIVAKYLLKMKTMPHLKGFNMLKHAVFLKIVSARAFFNGKILYESLGKVHDEKFTLIESCLRHCVNQAYDSGGLKELNKIFGTVVIDDKIPPTNLQLISLIAEGIIYCEEG